MKKINYFIVLAIALIFSACSKDKTQEELYDECKNGSVMICTRYYYELTLSDNEVLYFSGLDSDGDLENITGNVDEIKKNCSYMTGTGFFVDESGSILTNRHVVSPSIEESKIKEGYRNLINSLGMYYANERQSIVEQYNELEESKNVCYYWNGYQYDTDYNKLSEIESKQEELQTSYQELGQVLENLSSAYDETSFKIQSVCEIGIAYNDTHVTNENDMLVRNACAVVRISDKEDVDLALIQLKDHKTPEDKHIYSAGAKGNSTMEKIQSIFSKEKDNTIKMGQQLYMIGYNAGPILANTQTGIKVQMTSGKVTQLSDGQRLLYDIATVQGSSGSPVIDTKGNLVAVNFAKLNGSDNFNFGIPLERVKEFMNWK